MSTTDTRAAFEKAMNDARFFPAELDFTRTKSPSGRDEYANSHLQSEWRGWQAALVWQAATEAAKATGTAGELPPLPEALDCVKAVMRGEPEWMTPCDNYHTDDMMRAYAKKSVDAALAAMSEPTAQDGIDGLKPYEFTTCGKSLRWYLKRDVDALLAARQLAPVAQKMTLEQERESFKEYYQTRAAPLKYPDEYFALVEVVVSGWETAFIYEHDWMQKHWEMWEARANLANRSQP